LLQKGRKRKQSSGVSLNELNIDTKNKIKNTWKRPGDKTCNPVLCYVILKAKIVIWNYIE